ncbi:extracellular catalytic domain type 1 short-chain-length polyhydroxyalkanoate depolymerase [Allorhizobium undicola]|uniref:extracellular catalytic domain type 1 short-chain-length polyhydroxyalkanoate depolymerase n=1 Tax=Allorhizobium undicola TaxID=78527 RepID=UPI003D33CB7F
MHLKLPKSVSALMRQQRSLQRAMTRVAENAGWLIDEPKPRPASRNTPRLLEVTGFGHNPGHLRMLAYAPPQLLPNAPLVVVLHGCKQTAEEFDQASEWTKLARKHGFAVLYPEQRSSNNPNLCFNWFRPSAVAEDRGELGSIRQMIDWMIEHHGLDGNAVRVVGLSAGGAMAAALLAVYPHRFKAGAIVGGLPFGAARDAMAALSMMRQAPQKSATEWAGLVRQASPDAAVWPEISIWHGDADDVVDPGNGKALVSQWLGQNGLEDTSPQRETLAGGEMLVWKDEAGKRRVEFAALHGFGHGFPVGPNQKSQPFMLAFPWSLSHLLVKKWDLS